MFKQINANMLTIEATSMGAALVTLLMMIAVMLLAYFTTRWLGKRVTRFSPSQAIKIIEKVSVGQDKMLIVVKVADKTMLIGMSANAITKLCDIDDGAQILANLEKNQPIGFGDMLKSAIKKGKDENSIE